MVVVHVGERDIVERPKVEAEIERSQLISQRNLDPSVRAVTRRIGIRRGQPTIPQHPALQMLDDVARHDQLSNTCLVIFDTEACERIQRQVTTIEHVQLERGRNGRFGARWRRFVTAGSERKQGERENDAVHRRMRTAEQK